MNSMPHSPRMSSNCMASGPILTNQKPNIESLGLVRLGLHGEEDYEMSDQRLHVTAAHSWHYLLRQARR